MILHVGKINVIVRRYIIRRDDANEDWEDNLSDGIKVFKEKVLDLIEKNS